MNERHHQSVEDALMRFYRRHERDRLRKIREESPPTPKTHWTKPSGVKNGELMLVLKER
jgi:hypothetical protein